MSWRALLVTCLVIAPASAQAAGWTTSGVRVLDPAGQPFVISSINWYGAETRIFAPHGLWSQNYTTVLDEIKALGFSAIRLPYANETWQKNPAPSRNNLGGCPACQGKKARDILALVVNYAGSIGLHIIIDNHRSDGGNSAQGNGLWYYTSGKNTFTEQKWISDWVSVLRWTHGIRQTQGAPDTITVNYLASDGFPTVIGFDLRNEPHTVCQGGLQLPGRVDLGQRRRDQPGGESESESVRAGVCRQRHLPRLAPRRRARRRHDPG